MVLRLVGTTSNRWGVGSTVRLRSASGVQMRYLTLARGFMSSDEPVVHFGLGSDERIDELEGIGDEAHPGVSDPGLR